MDNQSYGMELILDLHSCDNKKFTRRHIKFFMKVLCEKIDMQRGPLYFWDDKWVPWFWKQTEPHLKGTTAIQFIMTSNITIHTLDLQHAVRLNIFSCKSFDENQVEAYASLFFSGKVVNKQLLTRY